MTDFEINRALALAIGWPPHDIDVCEDSQTVYVCTHPATLKWDALFQVFDYKAANVIWPIAERYGHFPIQQFHGSAKKITWKRFVWSKKKKIWMIYAAETAAKCAALAVIGIMQ